MIEFKPYPVFETVHRKTPDGAYFWHGNKKIDKSEAQVIVVGPLKATIEQYAEAAAYRSCWSGYKIRESFPMTATDPTHEEEVRRRGFLSIILDKA